MPDPEQDWVRSGEVATPEPGPDAVAGTGEIATDRLRQIALCGAGAGAWIGVFSAPLFAERWHAWATTAGPLGRPLEPTRVERSVLATANALDVLGVAGAMLYSLALAGVAAFVARWEPRGKTDVTIPVVIAFALAPGVACGLAAVLALAVLAR